MMLHLPVCLQIFLAPIRDVSLCLYSFSSDLLRIPDLLHVSALMHCVRSRGTMQKYPKPL